MATASVMPDRGRLEGLSLAEKRAMLDRLVRSGRAPAVAPCTVGQRAQWVYEQMQPGTAAYNEAFADRLRGELDPRLLRRSIEVLVDRHAALRTTFTVVGGEPMQRIAGSSRAALPVVDLQTLSEADRRHQATRLLTEAGRRPFDLESGPLMRLLLLRLDRCEHILLQVVHHIVYDVWSRSVFLRELAEVYDGLRSRRPARLPELATSYADYARWQRHLLNSPVMAEHLDYWRQRLTAAPVLLDLPTDRPRPAVRSTAGEKCISLLPHALVERLRSLGRGQGATLFMVFLAAFKVLLHRLSGATDLVVGTALAGRHRTELEGLVGYFVNLLAVRANLAGDPSFRQLLQCLRKDVLQDLDHQDLPFDRLIEELAPQRNLSQKPIFQVVFDFLEGSHRPVAPAGIEMETLQIERGIAIFDLLLVVVEQPAGWELTLQYSTDLFAAPRMKRLLDQYRTLLEDVAADVRRPVSALRLLGARERGQVLWQWNDSRRQFADRRPVHERFGEWARRTPGALAVASAERRMTYGDLDRLSGRWASWLRLSGVAQEARVGLLLERSAEMVAAMLAVLRAGGGFVPLDPEHPAERLARMIEDADCRLLLSRRRYESRWLDEVAVTPLWLEDAPAESAPCRPPTEAVDEKNLAYVIFTSGSTGRPRGVAVPHAGLCNLVAWHCETYGVEPADRAPWIASTIFDASVWEIWPYLCSGASLHLPGREQRTVPDSLWQWLAHEHISVAFLPTPLAEAALAALEQRPELATELRLRVLLTGGDRLHRGAPVGSGFRLLNHYGPTEVSVVSTMAPVAPETVEPPIGRAIANLRTYVLDSTLEPAPIGVPGELCVGGKGVARGYAARPSLSAERFVPDPFGRAGDRLYRTGDRVRWSEAGELEFLGRVDHQVKLRGYRIELGEIEAALNGHPRVKDAVVVLLDDDGTQRLVAYVAPESEADAGSGQEVFEGALRQHLTARLPNYMLPAVIEILPELPRGSSGKVDRLALPAPSASRREVETEYVQPRSELERSLAAAWCQVLKVGEVGIYDNFFDLGGHSLQLVQLHQLLQQDPGTSLSIVDLFNFPSIAALSRHLRKPVGDEPTEGSSGTSRSAQMMVGVRRLQQQRQRSAEERTAQKGKRP